MQLLEICLECILYLLLLGLSCKRVSVVGEKLFKIHVASSFWINYLICKFSWNTYIYLQIRKFRRKNEQKLKIIYKHKQDNLDVYLLYFFCESI